MPRLVHPSRPARLLAAVAIILVTAGIGAGIAAAGQPSCAKQVVNDWYDNGRVDNRIYPLACYRDAIASLPVDVIDYSNAKEEIGRALAYAKLGKPDPGPTQTTTTGTGPTTTSTSTTDTTTTGTGTTHTTTTDTTTTDTSTTDTSTADTTTTHTTTTGTGKTGTGKTGTDTSTTVTEATVDTSGPSSVPIPLIVLGGLAILLLAAGSAGYLARRANAGKGGDDGTPPASA